MVKISLQDVKTIGKFAGDRARAWAKHNRRLKILNGVLVLILLGLLGFLAHILIKYKPFEAQDKKDSKQDTPAPGSQPAASSPAPVNVDTVVAKSKTNVPVWAWAVIGVLMALLVLALVFVARERRLRKSAESNPDLKEEIVKRERVEKDLRAQLMRVEAAKDILQKTLEKKKDALEAAKVKLETAGSSKGEQKMAKTEVKQITKTVKVIEKEIKEVLVAEGELGDKLKELQESKERLQREVDNLTRIVKKAGLSTLNFQGKTLDEANGLIDDQVKKMREAIVAGKSDDEVEKLGEELANMEKARSDMPAYKEQQKEEMRQFREQNRDNFEESFQTANGKLRPLANTKVYSNVSSSVRPLKYLIEGKILPGIGIVDLERDMIPNNLSRMEVEAILHLLPEEYTGTDLERKEAVTLKFINILKEKIKKNEPRGKLSPRLERALNPPKSITAPAKKLPVALANGLAGALLNKAKRAGNEAEKAEKAILESKNALERTAKRAEKLSAPPRRAISSALKGRIAKLQEEKTLGEKKPITTDVDMDTLIKDLSNLSLRSPEGR